jgi:hypothetical protein
MKLLSLFVAVASSAVALAQSPLSMPFTANNGLSAGALVFFDLDVIDPSGITVHTLDVNTGTTVVGTVGSIDTPIFYFLFVGRPAWAKALNLKYYHARTHL